MKKERKEIPQKETYLQYTPYVDFLSRKRLNLIMEQVIAYTQEKQARQLKVLDMGCGIGGMTFPLSALGYQVVGVDFDSESISACNSKNTFPNARYIVGNGETLDLGEKFDVVISSEVLEHSPHPELLLQTIRRHLKDGGIGIVSVPNGYCPYELLFSRLFQKIGILSLFHKLPKRVYTSLTGSPSPYHSMNIFCNHVQFFSFGKFKGLLNSCGFRILTVRHLSLGLLLDWKWLSYLKRIECRVADYVPHFLAGGWVFVIKREDNIR